MTDFHTRYTVKVRVMKGQGPPKHPSIQNNVPAHDGWYTFPFIHKRPKYPAPHVPGTCRYVEDFIDVYGKENVRVEKLASVTEDFNLSIQRASISED